MDDFSAANLRFNVDCRFNCSCFSFSSLSYSALSDWHSSIAFFRMIFLGALTSSARWGTSMRSTWNMVRMATLLVRSPALRLNFRSRRGSYITSRRGGFFLLLRFAVVLIRYSSGPKNWGRPILRHVRLSRCTVSGADVWGVFSMPEVFSTLPSSKIQLTDPFGGTP